MTHGEATAKRDELASADPASTYVVAGSDADGWKVVKIGMAPEATGSTPTKEERPRPPHPDDVRTGYSQRVGSDWVGF